MCQLPTISGREAVRVFQAAGYEVTRITGSHHVIAHAGHPFRLSVPVHGNAPLKKGTLRGLIRDAGMTVEQFVALMQRG